MRTQGNEFVEVESDGGGDRVHTSICGKFKWTEKLSFSVVNFHRVKIVELRY